ncbi:MAG: TatD family hydrolase [Ferruginibacter sp.]
MKYINIHRHGHPAPDEWAIENIYKDFDRAMPGVFSVGLHPWYIDEKWEIPFHSIQNMTVNPSLLALGECGLDKVCPTDFALQQKVFSAHIELANKTGKPLIIHCVRAYAELMQLLQQHRNNVPVIFHGFHKNSTLAKEIASKGYFLSFGKALLQPAVQETLAALPPGRFFLETDDADISIGEIYQRAAEARQISAEELSLQLQQNLQQVFNIVV